MITVFELYDKLNGQNCRSCNSKGVQDETGTEVEFDCHAVEDCRFVVVAITLSGFVLFNKSLSIGDSIPFTLHTEPFCYDPCDPEFYNACVIPDKLAKPE